MRIATDMARIESEELTDPERVFVALSLGKARQAEDLLGNAGVDYAVEVEPVGKSFLFRSERYGAVFYVASGQATYCRTQLVAAGLAQGVVPDAGADI